MSQPSSDVDDVVTSDAELISHARAGSTASYAELVMRHRAAAVALVQQIAGDPDVDADELVGQAFDRVLEVLRSGGGPDVAFRAYLLAAVRRLQTSDAPIPSDPDAAFDDRSAGHAFASLPEPWQLVLWHLDVEGQTEAEVAPLLGMTPDAIPALADRARGGLRRACPDLGREPNSYLRAVIGPAVLGGAATAYLAPVAAASSSTDGRIGPMISRLRAAVSGHVTAAHVNTAFTVVVVASVVVSVLGLGHGSGVTSHRSTPSGEGPGADRTSRSAIEAPTLRPRGAVGSPIG